MTSHDDLIYHNQQRLAIKILLLLRMFFITTLDNYKQEDDLEHLATKYDQALLVLTSSIKEMITSYAMQFVWLVLPCIDSNRQPSHGHR